jgi:hypothetical protein
LDHQEPDVSVSEIGLERNGTSLETPSKNDSRKRKGKKRGPYRKQMCPLCPGIPEKDHICPKKCPLCGRQHEVDKIDAADEMKTTETVEENRGNGDDNDRNVAEDSKEEVEEQALDHQEPNVSVSEIDLECHWKLSLTQSIHSFTHFVGNLFQEANPHHSSNSDDEDSEEDVKIHEV